MQSLGFSAARARIRMQGKQWIAHLSLEGDQSLCTKLFGHYISVRGLSMLASADSLYVQVLVLQSSRALQISVVTSCQLTVSNRCLILTHVDIKSLQQSTKIYIATCWTLSYLQAQHTDTQDLTGFESFKASLKVDNKRIL